LEPGFKPGWVDLVPVQKAAKTPTRHSSNEVTGNAKYCDAGQDQKRHRANDTALQTSAREMTAHGLWPSDTIS
jgi:ribonuclease I